MKCMGDKNIQICIKLKTNIRSIFSVLIYIQAVQIDDDDDDLGVGTV
jgi:hypothetical protein